MRKYNLSIFGINKQIIKSYEKAIWNLPSNHTKKVKYKDKDIKEILRMEIPEKEKRLPGTLKKHLRRVKQFLTWSGREDFIKSGLENFIELVPDSVNANEKRFPFTGKELCLLFNNEVYENRTIFKKPSRYWLPLLALFTGGRGEELSQLYYDDILNDEDTGIDYMYIRENEERRQGLK